MILKYLQVTALLLSACQTTQSTDPALLTFRIPDGSTVSLNKDIEVPEYKTHAAFQAGKITTDRKRDLYRLNCRFDVREFGPRTIKPEVFKIRRTESGQEPIAMDNSLLRYYTDIFLDSDMGTDVIKLTCQEQGDNTDRPFTISDMETALGDFFTFTFQKVTTGQPGY
jgi:hypothetical protein